MAVVINEVSTSAPNTAAQPDGLVNEYIELRNTDPVATATISGWILEVFDADNSLILTVTIPTPTTLTPFAAFGATQFWVVANMLAPAAVPRNQEYALGSPGIRELATIILMDSAFTEMDRWSSVAFQGEGGTNAQPQQVKSRCASGRSPLSTDTNKTAADFALRDPRTPQAVNSAAPCGC